MIFRIVLLVLLILVVTTAIQKFVLGYYRKRLLSVVENKFAGRKIILMALDANFFGQKTKGGKQIRGNGALVLTEDELWFCLAVPQRELSIPLNQITAVELKKSHLSKTVFRPLLSVSFNYQGRPEQIAWHVNDPEKWRGVIEGLRK